MAETFTANYSWTKPEVGASIDVWGGFLNADLDSIDSIVKGISNAVPPPSSTTPIIDGTAAVGTGTTYARADHVHPTDTSRYAASNPSGYQTAAQVSAVVPAASSTTPVMDGTAAIGVGTTYARADHVHPSDTSKYSTTNPSNYQTAAQVTAAITAAVKAPTLQKFLTGSGTYTTAAGVIWIRVRGRAGGGGGDGGGSTQGTAAGAGGNTTFGTSLLVANGGAAGSWTTGVGGAGGVATIGAASPGGIANEGADGSPAPIIRGVAGLRVLNGGNGGGLGAGRGGATATGSNGGTNMGGGGGGGGSTDNPSVLGGPGGGEGGSFDVIIVSPAATYSYAVGAGGTFGNNGTNGFPGGVGGSGGIWVEEYYGS